MSSGKWRPSCLGLNVLITSYNGILNCSHEKSNIIIEIVLVPQTYMLTVSFKIS